MSPSPLVLQIGYILPSSGIGFEGDSSTTDDGGFILTGYTFSYGNGKSDIFLVKTDFEGNLQWTSAIGGQGEDIGKSVIQTSDGGFLVSGTIEFENNTMICLIKTNSEGLTNSLN